MVRREAAVLLALAAGAHAQGFCTVTAVDGTTVRNMNGCVAGGTVADGTQCIYERDAGRDCGAVDFTSDTDTYPETCASPTMGMDVPLTGPNGGMACTFIQCLSAEYSEGTIPGAASGTLMPCAVTAPNYDALAWDAMNGGQCTIQCDRAAGYVPQSGVTSCPDGYRTNIKPMTEQAGWSCTRVTCDPNDLNFAANNLVQIIDVSGCDEVGENPCSAQCVEGTAAAGGTPTISCTRLSDTLAEWRYNDPCVGPVRCQDYACPVGYRGINPTATCPDVTTAMGTATCTTGANNQARCCELVPCPAGASGPPTCNCDPGYTSNPAMPTWMTNSWAHTCTENRCPTINHAGISQGIRPTGTGGGTYCTDGTQLTSVNNNMCYMQCDDGYITNSISVMCNNNGQFDTAAPNADPGTFMCVEKKCSPYMHPEGQEAGTVNGCGEMEVLAPVTNPSCTIQCEPGWSGPSGTVSCPATASDGDMPVGSITCTRNDCSAYIYGPGVHGFPDGMIEPCSNNTGLKSGTQCAVGCEDGFSPQGGGDPATYRTYITCPETAGPNEKPTGGLVCLPTCDAYSCSDGWVKTTMMGVVCNTGTCTDNQCCTRAACPTNSGDVTDANGQTRLCVCNVGYTGAPSWDPTMERWLHTCAPNCANAFFAGCPSGETLYADADMRPCTGGGDCTSGSCAVCQTSDCCRDFVCQKLGDRMEYVVAGGSDCTTVSNCGDVECAPGYTGLAALTCPGDNQAITTTGCSAVDCPANAGGAGVCNCNSGYAIPGGGAPSWDAANNVWTHVCQATCTNTMFTGCQGKALKDGAETIFCTGTTGMPANDCTDEVCCSALCGTSDVCDHFGLLPKSNAAQLKCSGNDPNTCAEVTCCDATCGHPEFTNCVPEGYQDKPAVDSIRCSDANPATCTTELCCDITHCDLFTCPMTRVRDPNKTDCSGPCTEPQCCMDNMCTEPGDKFPWYTIAGAPSCRTVAQCGAVQCATGYSPVPGTAPSLACPNHMGEFVPSGCEENVCAPAMDMVGYTVQNPGCRSATSCGTITCAPGYSPVPGTTPMVMCPAPNGQLQGMNCQENACRSPNTPTWQQTYPGYAVANNDCTVRSQCGAVTCSPGYGGMPELLCLSPGGDFSAMGCNLNQCNPPLNNYPGYVIQNPNCRTAPQCGTISCAVGSMGAGMAVCPEPNGPFEISGCTPFPCPPNAEGAGCVCRDGYTGTPAFDQQTNTWTHTCTEVPCPENSSPVGVCNCTRGFTGVPAWNGTRWTHTCTRAACPANTDMSCNCLPGFAGTPTFDAVRGWTHTCVEGSCSPPGNSLPGYNVQFGTTCTTVAACGQITCGQGFSGTNPGLVCQTSGIFRGTGCTGAPCPNGAGPPGVCNCLDGYVGGPPQWTGSSWAHTCQAAACPANTNDVAGSCQCAAGFEGTPRWSGTQWTHTCTQGTGCPNGGVDRDPNCASQRPNCADPAILARCPCTCNSNFGGNQPPVFQLPGGTSVVGSIGPNTRAQFMTGVAGPEAGQTVTVFCTAANPALFSVQPAASVAANGDATLTFTGQQAGSSQVTCRLVDNGSPQRETPATFTITIGGGGPVVPPTPATNIAPCSGTCSFVGGSSVVSATTGQSYNSPLITNMGPVEAGQTVQVSCAAQDTTLFASQPQVSATGQLSFVAGARAGSTTVSCTATDNGVPARSTSFNFLVNVALGGGGGVTPPTPVGSVDQILSVRLRQPLRLSRSALTNALVSLLGVRGIVIYYVCPASLCNFNIRGCPASESRREEGGCLAGNQLPQGRGASVLARGFEELQGQNDVIVDFDILTNNADGSEAKNQERFTALQRLNADIAACNAGQSCVLASQQPTEASVLNPRPEADDDDDSMEWWVWLLIILGALLFLSCICWLLWYFCFRSEKEEEQEPQEREEVVMEKMVVTEEVPVTKDYTGDYSTDYSADYDTMVDFNAGDRVMAQYIDGTFYEATVEGRSPDGTYKLLWADGTQSEGVPPEQLRAK